MKLLLVDDSVQLSKRDGIIIVVVFVFVWFTGYVTGGQVTRILEKTKVWYDCIFTPAPEYSSRVWGEEPYYMRWLEIPAHRVLELESKELEGEFDTYDEDGNLCGGSSVYLLLRRKDGKRFNLLSS